MRCECCNNLLTENEISLKHTVTREFLDTCLKCLDGLDIPFSGNPNLDKKNKEEYEDEYGEDEDS